MNNYNKVHFVGIGGIGISGLAQHMATHGVTVSGSDRTDSDVLRKLQNMGITTYVGHSKDNVTNCDVVVRTSAVPDDNIEIITARQRGIPVMLREQMLGKVFNGYENRIAVCGVHGKTTVTAMLDYVFEQCNATNTLFAGGITKRGNYHDGDNCVIAEACEYRESFKYLSPTITTCLNVALDHTDYYKNDLEVERAFGKFFGNIAENGHLVVCNSVKKKLYRHLPVKVTTFGYKHADFYAKDVTDNNGYFSFTVMYHKCKVARVTLGVVGKHNVLNALACIATAYVYGLPLLQVVHSIGGYSGVERRWTQVKCSYTNVVCDYAHHPTEIKATVATALCMHYSKVYAVFQPHTYTRTQHFLTQFAKSFKGITQVGFLPVFSAREQPICGVDNYALCNKANKNKINACVLNNFEQAVEFCKQATKKDLVLIIGAGDVDTVAKMLTTTD